jgi:hypothetical protein
MYLKSLFIVFVYQFVGDSFAGYIQLAVVDAVLQLPEQF